MPTHAEKRVMPYSSDEMFELIAGIDKYPEFLPWCSAARIRTRRPDGPREVLDAELVISFKVFRERFGSRVLLRPDEQRIDVSYIDGPFRYLTNQWHFRSLEGLRCEVVFFVDLVFRSRTLRPFWGSC
ncbi:MAG: SRPBCC family protein [Pseudomonadota bacterium]